MITRTLKTMLALVAAGAIAACGGSGLDASSDAAKTKQDPKLNISHMECTDDGRVYIHLVLLHTPSNYTPPTDLTGYWEDEDGNKFDIYGVRRDPKTGNVWHYDAYTDDTGVMAKIVIDVGGYFAWNTAEFETDWTCDGTPQCEGVELPYTNGEEFCADLPNNNECAALGLELAGKDDLDDPASTPATQDAFVAILKSGRGGQDGCPQGEFSYRIYIGVSQNQTLVAPSNTNAISHVTYCECPTPAE